MEIRIDSDKKIAYITVKGVVSGKDVAEAFKRVLSMEEYEQGMARIWDMRQGDFTKGSIDDIIYVCEHTSILSDDTGVVRVALVAGEDLSLVASSAFTAIAHGADPP